LWLTWGNAAAVRQQCRYAAVRSSYNLQVLGSKFDPVAPLACPDSKILFQFLADVSAVIIVKGIKKRIELTPQFIDLVFELFSLTIHRFPLGFSDAPQD